jgi:CheY-like chemotaxis protein
VKGAVLLVEDEDDTREMLSGALIRAGYRSVTAASVEEALKVVETAGFIDVAVTDVVLGDDERGGLRLLNELRRVGVRAPVVVITAYADVDKLKTALHAGAAHAGRRRRPRGGAGAHSRAAHRERTHCRAPLARWQIEQRNRRARVQQSENDPATREHDLFEVRGREPGGVFQVGLCEVRDGAPR